MNKNEVLKRHFGHDSFREGQESIIDNIMSGRDVLAIMPTGAGKSLCYQVPALMLEGITLVISPLIALMKDQVAALKETGVAAAYLNSSLTPYQQELMLQRASMGQYKIIYVAPERLTTASFVGFAKQANISLIAVDEAHCVSQWGQDFRPSYLEIAKFVEQMPRRPILTAFTATATGRVRSDINEMLQLRDPMMVVNGFDRPNLRFEVQTPGQKYGALVNILRSCEGQSGIVYCLTTKTVEELCDKLNKDGFSVTRYHGKLSQQERSANQEDFLYDRKLIVVATCAFGMGIDKSNVSFVVHYNMPRDIESYYQEAGRAGRDGSPARCVLLYSAQDIVTNKLIMDHSFEEEPEDEEQLRMRERNRALALRRLNIMADYCATVGCLRAYILNYFGERSPERCDNCSNCCEPSEMADITVDAQKVISCVIRMERLGKHFGKGVLNDVLRGIMTDMVAQHDLDKIKTFGAMKGCTVKYIRAVIGALMQQKLLTQSEGEYPIILCSEDASKVLTGEKKVYMKAVPGRAKGKRAKSESEKLYSGSLSSSVTPSLSMMAPVDEALFNVLKALRGEIAREIGKPPFVVFSDATLRNMCRLLPENEEQFGNVPGIGAYKKEKYAARFTEVIAEYIKNKPEEEQCESEAVHEVLRPGTRVRPKDRMPLSLSEVQIASIELSDDPITINYLAEIINEAVDRRVMQNTTGAKLNQWLIRCGYLVQEGESKVPTEAGEALGISSEQRTGSNNRVFTLCFYDIQAQRYVAQHINMAAKDEVPSDAPNYAD